LSDVRLERLKLLIDFGLPLGCEFNPLTSKLAKSLCHFIIIAVSGILNFIEASLKDVFFNSINFQTLILKSTL